MTTTSGVIARTAWTRIFIHGSKEFRRANGARSRGDATSDRHARSEESAKEVDMVTPTEVILQVFRAVEARDVERFIGLCQPDEEFPWPPTLPHGGAATGRRLVAPARRRRRGRDIDEAVLGRYEISDAKLARGQMFYFDPAGLDVLL
jgi:hypothetical protein